MLLVVGMITATLCAACVGMIALYATWLLGHRLRRGESKRLAFGQWIRHLFDAIMGL